jgi:hypothetical protein
MVGTYQPEDAMNKLVFAIALFSFVPAMRAQQAETSANAPKAASQTETQAASPSAPQPPAQNPNAQDNLPASTRPGHPLDPADVDVLTGKRDREIAAAQRAAIPITVGMYGDYGDLYAMQGRFGRGSDIPMLPLPRISDPFFFSTVPQRGFGRGRIRGAR